MQTAIVFPGQGSQSAESRALVAEACPELLERCVALVGEDPFARCEESTRFAQPAIFCASIAGLSGRTPADVVATAGHSLGDLTALAAGGVLAVYDALALVVTRGRLMAEAAERDPSGGMLALLRASVEQARALAERHDVHVANDNAPGQVVLSGDREHLAAARADAADQGLRAIALGVSGAFHSPAMASAAEPFAAAVRGVTVRTGAATVFSSITATPFVDVPTQLTLGITRPVRWRETLLALRRFGVERFVDAGPGQVMTGLVKRTLGADALLEAGVVAA